MYRIVPSLRAERIRKKRKITCLTCKLKGCVGRCRWEAWIARTHQKQRRKSVENTAPVSDGRI